MTNGIRIAKVTVEFSIAVRDGDGLPVLLKTELDELVFAFFGKGNSCTSRPTLKIVEAANPPEVAA